MISRWLVLSSSVGWLWLSAVVALAQRASNPLENLHEACRLSDFEAIQRIPPAEMDLAKKGTSGRAALHWAVEGRARRAEDRFKVVSLLIERGANVNLKSGEGLTPLQYASRAGWDPRIVELLISRGASVDEAGGFGQMTPPGTPLSMAAGRLDLALVQLLLSKRAKPDVRGTEGQTALHRVYESGSAFDEEPRNSQAARVIKAVLEAGADPNAQDLHGHTPLHRAAMATHVEGFEQLVTHGANIGAVTNDKLNVMHIAVHKPLNGVRPLLEYIQRSDPKLINQRDANGNTPLHTAVNFGNHTAVQTLLLLGADAGLRNAKGERPLDLMMTIYLDGPTVRMLQKYTPSPSPPPDHPPTEIPLRRTPSNKA
jgi:ankyrin repeat protein